MKKSLYLTMESENFLTSQPLLQGLSLETQERGMMAEFSQKSNAEVSTILAHIQKIKEVLKWKI